MESNNNNEIAAAPGKPEIKVKRNMQNLARIGTDRNEKPKYSTFHLTMNTNQQYKPDDPNLANDIQVFDETVGDILNNIGDYIKLPDGAVWSDELIEDVDIDYVVEVGGKKHQIHTHILLKFKHKTKIQLDYEKIKAKMKASLGIDVYMYNRLIRNNDADTVKNYILKMT